MDMRDTLVQSIESSLDKHSREFQWDSFFQTWFRDRGSPYFFLFKKHLGVTNTQVLELFALLETYARDASSGSPKSRLLFHTTQHIKDSFVEILYSVLDAEEDAQTDEIRNFAEQNLETLSSTVAVDLFYCSVAVALPPGIQVDLNQVCADSGYIHSAGRSIYIRNLKKARVYDFKNKLRAHVQTCAASEFPIPFVVYAHEDFSEYDTPAKEQISRGIDTTKLFLEKMSMGAYRLAEIVESLRSEYSTELTIPQPGSYTENHNFRTKKTLWLIGERSLSKTTPTNLGRERYYICYEQTVKNENPFFMFDENKPAWKSHTTLPHSLTAALINIARPESPEAVFCDPFGGTGTTWLEAKRLGLPEQLVYTSDVSPIGPLMIQDNLAFFLSSAEKLKKIKSQLCEIDKAIRAAGDSGSHRYLQGELPLEHTDAIQIGLAPYSDAKKVLEQLRVEQPNEEQEYLFSEAVVDKVRELTPLSRFLFYVGLRAQFRYQGGLKRKSTVYEKAFLKSLSQLLEQIDQLIKVRHEFEKNISCEGGQNFCVFQGAYSKETVSSFFLMAPDDYAPDVEATVKTKDARHLDPNSMDVIICDPPYGFNTTEDQGRLAALYSEFIENSLRALRHQGQLIVCLPSESFTGRELPYCTRSDLITNQVLVKAKELGRQVIVPARSLPVEGLSPPYYWEAERALRRTILHFRIL